MSINFHTVHYNVEMPKLIYSVGGGERERERDHDF